MKLTKAQREALREWWDRENNLVQSIIAERRRTFASLEKKGLVSADGKLTEDGRMLRIGLITDAVVR